MFAFSHNWIPFFSPVTRTDADVYKNNFLENWADIPKTRKPIIAAVSGYAVRLNYICLSLQLISVLARRRM